VGEIVVREKPGLTSFEPLPRRGAVGPDAAQGSAVISAFLDSDCHSLRA
jgi:hypothetical protein